MEILSLYNGRYGKQNTGARIENTSGVFAGVRALMRFFDDDLWYDLVRRYRSKLYGSWIHTLREYRECNHE